MIATFSQPHLTGAPRSAPGRIWRPALALGLALVFGAFGLARGNSGTAPQPPAEYFVKAGFLYNFAKLTEWPAADGAFDLCVYGRDPFGAYLDALHGKSAGSRTIAVARLKDAVAAKTCEILFVAAEGSEAASLIAAVRDLPVLTVGDSVAFARAGGIIGLRVVEDRVRFEVNLNAAQRAGLRLSSRMLSLADITPDRSEASLAP